MVWWTGGAVGNVATSQLQDCRVDPELGLLSVWSLTCCVCVCMGFLWVLQCKILLGVTVYGALQWTG